MDMMELADMLYLGYSEFFRGGSSPPIHTYLRGLEIKTPKAR